jgi:mannose-6-phosphate isomerase-like protein (cupin superfamily)
VSFDSKVLPAAADAIAPDGSAVRVLLALPGGSVAHFALSSGQCSVAVQHRTVEEIWFVLGGRGEMWRSFDGRSEVTALHAGTCITVPRGTVFQFRSLGPDELTAIAMTMPPWPGDGEAVRAEGAWAPTVAPGAGLVAP